MLKVRNSVITYAFDTCFLNFSSRLLINAFIIGNTVFHFAKPKQSLHGFSFTNM